jgi:hypothetical protein
MFHSRTSKLQSLQESQEDIWSQMDQSTTTLPTQDDASRCSFYAILPHQTILFRGGYVDGANSSSDDAAIYSIVSMIVFSSTTTCLRSKLMSMGVHLRVATQNKHFDTDSIDERKNFEVLYTESLIDASTATNGVSFGEGDAESVQSDLDVMKLVNNDKDQVRVEVKKRNQQRTLGKAGSVRLPPLFVYGDDDCATVYELLMNTYGLSVGLEESTASKSGSESVALDVPLLLCRSLGPCMHTTLRTLSFSSRRNCGYLNQMQTNIKRDTNSKAALELRGPILPCALRDMTCAVVNFMMIDNYAHDQSSTSTPHSMNMVISSTIISMARISPTWRALTSS